MARQTVRNRGEPRMGAKGSTMKVTFFSVNNGGTPQPLVTVGDKDGKIVVVSGSGGIVEGLNLLGHPAAELKRLPSRFAGSRFFARKAE